MAISFETKGTMVNLSGGGQISLSQDILFRFNEAPKGHLSVTNLTTGATKSYVVASLEYGQNIWDWSADDPTASAGDQMKLEYFGSCGSGVVWFLGQGNQAPETAEAIQGNGTWKSINSVFT